MKILLTGFDPFGGEKINPSYEAVKKVRAPEGTELIRLEVPTVFGRSVEITTEKIRELRPDAVICVGQAGGRSAVTPERVAINLMDAGIADNAGRIPVDEAIVPGGENALFSTLPVKKITAAIQKAGIPARLSNTAGTFVCNQLLYGVLDFCREHSPETKACFIHLPYLPEQTEKKPEMPSLPLDRMAAALEAAIACIAENRNI